MHISIQDNSGISSELDTKFIIAQLEDHTLINGYISDKELDEALDNLTIRIIQILFEARNKDLAFLHSYLISHIITALMNVLDLKNCRTKLNNNVEVDLPLYHLLEFQKEFNDAVKCFAADRNNKKEE